MWAHNHISNTSSAKHNYWFVGEKTGKKTKLECPLKATLPHKRPLSFTKAATDIDKKDFPGLFSLLIDDKIF